MGIAAMQNNPVSNIVFLCLKRCGYSCCTTHNENVETKNTAGLQNIGTVLRGSILLHLDKDPAA